MSKFQEIKDKVLSAKTPEELACVLVELSTEQQRACMYNTQMSKCDMSVCGKYSSSCCNLGMTEYLKFGGDKTAEPVNIPQEVDCFTWIRNKNVGDILEVKLKNCNVVEFEKVHSKAGISFFVLKDIWPYLMHMNATRTAVGGYPGSYLNKWLNEDVLELIPDELKEVILPRKITQDVNGRKYSTVCKLWIPSIVEVYGKDDIDTGEEILNIEPNNEQFEWFKSKENIVKDYDNARGYWWLRTPFRPSSTSNFCYINASGDCLCSVPSVPLGIVFGFCI